MLIFNLTGWYLPYLLCWYMWEFQLPHFSTNVIWIHKLGVTIKRAIMSRQSVSVKLTAFVFILLTDIERLANIILKLVFLPHFAAAFPVVRDIMPNFIIIVDLFIVPGLIQSLRFLPSVWTLLNSHKSFDSGFGWLAVNFPNTSWVWEELKKYFYPN